MVFALFGVGRSAELFCGLVRAREKLADQNGGRILAGFLGEALGERGYRAFREIELEAFDAMHREEHDAGGEGLAVADLGSEIVERREINAAKAEAERRETKNRAPEFFAGVSERRDDDGAGTERGGRLWCLVKARVGHGAIVVWGRGKLQTDESDYFNSGPTADGSEIKIFDLE
jgi:hypothetical protein